MFLCFILLTVSLVSSLHGFHVSSCDKDCQNIPVLTPSRLVVQYGDPISASCSCCQGECSQTDMIVSDGLMRRNDTTIMWMVDNVTDWDISAVCYHYGADYECCSELPVTVYKPPDSVSMSFLHTGPVFEGHQYPLQCTVQDVAPVKNLVVTFLRGETPLGQPQSKHRTEKRPMTEIFTLNVTLSQEDDGVHFWCEARLELGPEGPKFPLVMSDVITVHLESGDKVSMGDPDLITIPSGHLQGLFISAAAGVLLIISITAFMVSIIFRLL